MSRCRRLRIPREKCPIFGGNADDRPSHIAAPVVNNRLADKQEYCLTAMRAYGRTVDAAAAKENGHPQGAAGGRQHQTLTPDSVFFRHAGQACG
jgi:hypothetical protein